MKEIKRTGVKKNFLYNMLYEVLVLAVPFLTTPYIARVLGSENVGIYNYVSANVTYFSLLAVFGSLSFAKREIAVSASDPEKVTASFWGMFTFRMLSTLAALVCFGAFCLWTPQYRMFYMIAGVSVLSVGVDVSWFFQGIENFKVTVIRNVIIKLGATALIFLLVRKPDDLIWYFAITVGSIFLGNCSLWVYLRRYVGSFSWKYFNFKKYFTGSLKMFIPALAIQVYTVLDKTMLGALVNVTEVGYYSQAEKIVTIIITMVNSLSAVLLPRISALVAADNFTEAERYYKKSVGVVAMLAIPCAVGCLFVAEDFIPLFLGDGYEPSIRVLQILSLLFVILGMARIIGTPLLIPLGRENRYTIAVCSGAVVNVVLNGLLIPRLGAVGAAVATIAAESVVTCLEIFFVRDRFSPKYILKSVGNYLLTTAAMAVVLLVCYQFIPSGVLRLVISVVLGAGTYFLLLILRKDPLLQEMVLSPLKKRLYFNR